MSKAKPTTRSRFSPDDQAFMQRALDLAARALGETNPNPVVGCVLVRAGRIVGEGFHARAGEPHAEPQALQAAGPAARGATAYVTLEPCAHMGRTGPCAPQLIAAGVTRVVVALRDPHALVDGRGLRLLRRAGLSVEVGLLAGPAALLNERFITYARHGRPFVLLKAAMTLDGRLATARGDSKWITSAAQRRAARRLRRLHDGVLVGVGTALADDPLLLPAPRLRRPFVRIVLDTHARLRLDSRLVRSVGRGPVLVLCGAAANPRALEQAGVWVERAPATAVERDGRLAIRWVLAALARRGLTSVMVEGGSEVLGSFLAARACDQVALFQAPRLLGGRGSRPAFGGPDPARIGEALELSATSPLGSGPAPARLLLGEDAALCQLWYPRRPARRPDSNARPRVGTWAGPRSEIR
jgi:diaminohydroxyphosphoribosylaminopyrimidine deaminase/5-amino-6-(5-phosphoribosylamino)uracil reductase